MSDHPSPTSHTVGMRDIEAQYIARSLLIPCLFVTPEHSNDDILQILNEQLDIFALPVTESGKPIGLINRNIFLSGMTKPYRKELYGRKSCIAFMDKDPLIVSQQTGIQTLSMQVVNKGGKTLHDGFIITDEAGYYMGLGTGEQLVKTIAQLQAEKNRLVIESINYASIIQKSFLRSSQENLQNADIAEYFIHWEPRDQVGGDYYFCRTFDDGFFFAMIDCTGHGVPGAFMTLIMSTLLDQILTVEQRNDPAGLMLHLNKKVKILLNQVSEKESPHSLTDTQVLDQSDDGMDGAFCWFNTQSKQLIYAGAKITLFYIHPDTQHIGMLTPDRQGIGYVDTPIKYTWNNKPLAIPTGSLLYLSTDGMIDQIGGPKHIAWGKKRLMNVLLEHHQHPLSAQKQHVLQHFYTYQGSQRRRDDISIVGFKI